MVRLQAFSRAEDPLRWARTAMKMVQSGGLALMTPAVAKGDGLFPMPKNRQGRALPKKPATVKCPRSCDRGQAQAGLYAQAVGVPLSAEAQEPALFADGRARAVAALDEPFGL